MRQQILDCSFFGANSIEVIPPGLDDADFSPHFSVSWLEMLEIVSDFCDMLDLQVSIWFPAFFKSYKDDDEGERGGLQLAKKHWELIFSHLPRLDILFIPGGDPGGHPPEELLLNIGKLQLQFLKNYNQQLFGSTELWISTQFGLSHSVDVDTGEGSWKPREREDKFFEVLRTHQSELLNLGLKGIVYGPWSSYTLKEFRRATPSNFKLRNYPDLCHCVGCEFPMQSWPIHQAMAHGREPITVRPQFFWNMCEQGEEITDILGMYSEGINDDVNKFVCLVAAWEGASATMDIKQSDNSSFLSSFLIMENDKIPSKLLQGLNEYCRLLCHVWDMDLSQEMSRIILDLERRDWVRCCPQEHSQQLQRDHYLNLSFFNGVTVETTVWEGIQQTDSTSALTGSSDQDFQYDFHHRRRSDTFSTFRTFERLIQPFLQTNPKEFFQRNWRLQLLKLRVYYDQLVDDKLRNVINSARAKQENMMVSLDLVRSMEPVGGKGQLVPCTAPTDGGFTNDNINQFPTSAPYGGGFTIGRRMEQLVTSNYPNVFAEVVGLTYLLYCSIGYQVSVGVGGQHRQRGAFCDLLLSTNLDGFTGKIEKQSMALKHCVECEVRNQVRNVRNLNTNSNVTSGTTVSTVYTSTKGVTMRLVDGVRREILGDLWKDNKILGYLNVGESFQDFVIGIPQNQYSDSKSKSQSKSSFYTFGDPSQPASQNLPITQNTKGMIIKKPMQGVTGNCNNTDQLWIRPIFIAPPQVDGQNRKSESVQQLLSQSESSEDSASRLLVQDTLIDQMYYSMIFETIASDHDTISQSLIPNLPRCVLRWAVTL